MCLTVSFPILSQQRETTQFNLINNSATMGIGYINVLDSYLSPFEYTGQFINLNNENRSYLFANDTVLSYSNKYTLQIGDAKHPTQINSMMYFNGSYNVGVHYHFRPTSNFTYLFGGSWDINLGGKYIARNVNNPLSLDFHTNINISFSSNYKFHFHPFDWFSQNIRFEYGIFSPILGCMFVPSQGVSYYEIFSLGNYSNVFHFTSLHNKRALSQYLNIDFPTRFTIFRISLNNNLMQYKAHNTVYHLYNSSINVGLISDFYIFEGTKNKPPKSFKSSY